MRSQERVMDGGPVSMSFQPPIGEPAYGAGRPAPLSGTSHRRLALDVSRGAHRLLNRRKRLWSYHPVWMTGANPSPRPGVPSQQEHRRRRCPAMALTALAFALAACSSPTQAPGSSRQTASGPIKGYGVLGVEGPDLASMLRTCGTIENSSSSDLSGADQDLRTRCDQLRRTMGTQPGNSVRAER